MALSAVAIALIAVSAGTTVLSALAQRKAIKDAENRKIKQFELEAVAKRIKLKKYKIEFDKRLALMTGAQGVAMAGTPLLIGEEAEKEFERNVNAVNRAKLYGVWGAQEDSANRRMANLINMGTNLANIGVMAATGYQQGQDAKKGLLNKSFDFSKYESSRYKIGSY